MIPIVNTTFLLEEKPTDGHSPMYFLCDNGENYYCKYRTQIKREEIDCLAYEIVCTHLLKHLNIPTPEIAFVQITKESLDLTKLKKNKRYSKPGIICFGSKEVPHSDLITGIQTIATKSQLNKFIKPYDLLKIAMFDLWVDNVDRGRNDNYNLLIQGIVETSEKDGKLKTTYKNQWVAFDNAFTFGGVDRIGIFNETMRPNTYNKLIISSYFKEYKKHLNKNVALNIVENFLSLNPDEIANIIDNVFQQLPAQWKISRHLKDRIFRFITSPDRIQEVKNISMHALKNK